MERVDEWAPVLAFGSLVCFVWAAMLAAADPRTAKPMLPALLWPGFKRWFWAVRPRWVAGLGVLLALVAAWIAVA